MKNKAEEEYLANGGYYDPYEAEQGGAYNPPATMRPQTTGGPRRRGSSQGQRKFKKNKRNNKPRVGINRKRNQMQRKRAMTAKPKKRIQFQQEDEHSYNQQPGPQHQEEDYGVRFNGIDPEEIQEDIQVMMNNSQPPKVLAQSIPVNQRSWDKDKSNLVSSHK